jgi:transposase-like protein
MANPVLNAPHFQSEPAAFAYVEARLWPQGPACPRCDEAKRLRKLEGVRSKPSRKNPEGVEQHGLYKCYRCSLKFSVRKGTIFEDSPLPLHLWLQIIHLMCCSKKGVSTRQVQRMLQCSMKTAWHLTHRIRLAMAPAADASPLGGPGKTIEADDTEIARSRKTRRPEGFRRTKHNVKVLTLVERGGNQRSVTVDHRGAGLMLRRLAHLDSRLVTDKGATFKNLGFAEHESVDHSKYEWARGDVHTNTLEGFFSVFKRGIIGVYQHVDKRHFDRYLAEFDFRQNNREKLGVNDARRAEIALQGMRGKRLMYRDSFAG